MVAKMGSRKHPPTTMEKLPNDLLSKIFIRLLAKQVAQMRSVNKSWNTLLCQPCFIKSHLHHSIHNKDDVLLFFYEPPPRSLPLNEPFSAHSSKSPNLKLTDFIKPPGNVNFQWRYNSIIGSVNGLICLNHGSVVHIWNPSLSAVSTLPPYFVPCPDNDPIGVTLRFGYDPKADDYKVIKLASIVRPSSFQNPRFRGFNDFVEEWLPVEVCSMRKGSWKPITQSFPSHITRISSEYEQVCFDGHDGLLHWLGYIGQERKGPTIVAFDLGAETFHEIPLPDSIIKRNVSNRVDVLGVLTGKLCVMSYTKGGESEVWVMDQYGVVESWVKNHAFSHFRNIVPLGFTLRNEFLFQVEKVDGHDDDDDRFGLYDPVEAKTKVFKVSKDIKKIVGYVDSLVRVAPDKHEMS